MNRNIKCSQNDLNPDLTDFFLESNSDTSEDTPNLDNINISQNISFEMDNKKQEKKQIKEIIGQYFNNAIFFISVFIFYIGVFLGAISTVFSLIFLIITVFMFFVSFITSYVMCPVYHFLNNDWLDFVPSILQVFLSSPLVSFFFFFFVNLIRKVGDLAEAIIDLFKIPFQNIKDVKKKARTFVYYELNRCVIFVYLFLSLIVVGVGFMFVWMTFLVKGVTLFLGFLIIIPMLIEIIYLLIIVYPYWFKILFNLSFKKDYESDDCTRKMEKKCISCCIDLINKYDAESDDDEEEKKINQTTQTFLNDKGQISSKIGYSQIENDIEEINSFTITETKENEDFCLIFVNIFKQFRHIIFMKELIPLYDFARQIITNHRKKTKLALLWIFTILNIALVAFDVYRAVKNPNVYFIIATSFRILVFPLFSFYHIILHFIVKVKDKALRIIHHITFVFTIIVIIIIIACFAMKTYYKKNYRIHDFQYKPINESLQYYNDILLSHPICLFNQFGVNSIDAYSYAIAVYDVTDNPALFDEQMKTFFGENYSSFIDVDVENISEEVPFVIYTNKLINTTIVGFRSFNSGPEIAFMLQIIAEYYVVPFFSDLIPFMDTITDFFLDYPIGIAHEFGRMMFDPTNSIKDYVEIIEKICIDKGIDQLDRVLFTGIGTGATFGKIVSIYLKKYSISFLTLPVWNDFFTNVFNLDDNDMNYITNVYIYNSFFSKPEPDLATNIGIFPTPFDNGIPRLLCNSDLCEINFKGETNYPTFCLIAGMCGYNAKFDHFCRSALPNKNDLDEINDFVKNFIEE